jgi:hypothetical protein
MLDMLLSEIPHPELVIVVYDRTPGPSSFSCPDPGRIAAAVQNQPTLWSVAKRVNSLLVPQGDLVTYKTLYKRMLVDGVDRHYVLVPGDNFDFDERLGRDFFVPDSRSVLAKFGPVDGPVVAAMVTEFQASLR